MNYTEATEWLFGTQQFGIKLGLENTERLLNELKLPHTGAKVLHVAGTNGKGSTCAFADSIARATGRHTGLFTSPHLIRLNERARVSGIEITNEAVARHLTALRELVADWPHHPTFFELVLAMALLHFKEEQCDTLILETGMGGRLDATNALAPTANAITPIGLDHQKWLGNDLATIAAEKAGILKSKTPCALAPQPPEPEAVILARASEIGAPILSPTELPDDALLGLPGDHQRDNAALALALIAAAGIHPTPEQLLTGLAKVQWRARFQKIPTPNGHLIIDGAHNPAAAETLVATWKEQFGTQQAQVIFGSVEGKDTAAILEILSPIASTFFFTEPNSPRAIPASDLAKLTATPSKIIPNPIKALTQAPSPLTLVAGSLYLAGQILSHLETTPFQPSSQ